MFDDDGGLPGCREVAPLHAHLRQAEALHLPRVEGEGQPVLVAEDVLRFRHHGAEVRVDAAAGRHAAGLA